ncbi:MAG: hypothetical protein Q8O13_10705 [Candidatus Omnitrophota bacterium]|nr:hypothetical protein [Candidatus Omnitrophota bacterium]
MKLRLNKKPLVSLMLLIFLFCLSLFAADIPAELQKLGFTQYTLVDYQKDGDTEYFTFSDWRTEQSGDTVTFIVENGKVKS